MKLHLSTKATISSLPPQVEAVRCNDALIYYNSPHLLVACISTGRILHKAKYEDVQLVRVHDGLLYVCASDIHILDLCSYELVDVVRLSKALIDKVAMFGNSILVSKMNSKVVHILDRKVTFEFPVPSLCEGLFMNNLFYGYYDSERVVVFSRSGAKTHDVEVSEVIGAVAIGGKVFVLDAHGALAELVSGESVELGLSLDMCRMSQGSILAASGDVVYEIDYSGTIVCRQTLLEMIEKYSGSVRDICCGRGLGTETSVETGVANDLSLDQSKRLRMCELSNAHDLLEDKMLSEGYSLQDESASGADSEDEQQSSQECSLQDESASRDNNLVVAFLGEDFVRTSGNDFVFTKNGTVSKIISFVDDVTDSMEYEGRLILSTSSGFMKYTSLSQYTEGEYVFDSRMVRISQDSITSAKVSGSIVIAGLKEKMCQAFKITLEGDRLVFSRIYEFRDFRAPIVSLAFDRNMLAVASSDNILQIYRGQEQNTACGSPENCMARLSAFENVSTQRIHTKPITHVAITPRFVITSSADRSSKVLDHNGTLVTTLQSDKILSSSHDAKHVAVSSHKAIRVYHSPSLSQAAVFQSKRPVLSSCFHSGYLLGVTDVLRVYDLDKKRCVKSYDLELVNCWSFNYPFLCAENKIVILEDRSREMHEDTLSSVRAQRESAALVSKFLREGRFGEAVGILLKRGDNGKAHRALVEGFYSDRSLSFLDDLLKNSDMRVKMAECLLKHSGFKHSEVFNLVAQRLFQTKLGKDKKERMLQTIMKHAGALDEMFVDLLSLDIFNKQP